MREWFDNYAYPVSDEYYDLWSHEPEEWKPINHSCEPNLWYKGDGTLRIVARRDIKQGEELTLDYVMFLANTHLHFDCNCGESSCRHKVTAYDYKI